MKYFLSFLTVLATQFPFVASAHVRYIANDTEVAQYGGPDINAFVEPLSHPPYLAIIIITTVVFLGLYFCLSKSKTFARWAKHTSEIGVSYQQFTPWIIRLSLGIALLGAGTNGFFLSPVLGGNELLSFVQILLGFFLMAGFLVGPSATAVLVLFIAAIIKDPYLVGSFDMLALILALLVIDGRKPGIDEIVGIPDVTQLRKFSKFVPTLLRSGIGIAMIYLAIVEKVLNPHLSAFVAETTKLVDVIPVSSAMWTFSAGVIEFVIGLFLLIGFKTRLSSVIALVVLSLSFFYFGEDVASHITLFGILSLTFIFGGGPLSVDAWFARKKTTPLA